MTKYNERKEAFIILATYIGSIILAFVIGLLTGIIL